MFIRPKNLQHAEVAAYAGIRKKQGSCKYSKPWDVKLKESTFRTWKAKHAEGIAEGKGNTGHFMKEKRDA